MSNSLQLIPVPFRGTTLYVIDHEGQPHTPMKPIVEGMGLSWQGQHEKLSANKARFFIKEIVMQMPGDDQRRNVCCLPLRKLSGWLMSVHPAKVNPEIRDTIMLYQNECDDVLWKYWTEGQAVNPRLAEVTPSSLPQLHFALNRAMRTLVWSADAFVRQLAVNEIQGLCSQLGIRMPSVHLIGKPFGQVQLEV